MRFMYLLLFVPTLAFAWQKPVCVPPQYLVHVKDDIYVCVTPNPLPVDDPIALTLLGLGVAAAATRFLRKK
jgi:hypothetical protein